MTLRKTTKLTSGLLLILTVVIGLILINHPIILKWLTGSARLIGRPIRATIYTNGQVNDSIKVFHVDKYWNGSKADYYLLFMTYVPDNSRLKFFSVNRQDQYVGRPSATNIRDYDYFAGLLFQSEVGGHFTPFWYSTKGYDFDSQLTFTDKQITLLIPPLAKELKCDSLRIKL